MRQLRVRKVFRKRTHVAAEDVPSPVLPELDVEDLDLKDVTARRATDVVRPGEDVIARPFLHPLTNLDDMRENIEAAVLCRHPLGIAGGAFDRHPLAGIDCE